jgi:hypothetical protein
MSEGHYLIPEKEARLLAAVLDGLDGDKHAADRILSDLIELGLADADIGPFVYDAWAAAVASDEDNLSQDDLVRLYLVGDLEEFLWKEDP